MQFIGKLSPQNTTVPSFHVKAVREGMESTYVAMSGL